MSDIIISDIPEYRAGREAGRRAGIDGKPHATAYPFGASESYRAGWTAGFQAGRDARHQSRTTGIPVVHLDGDSEISHNAWRLLYCTPGWRLREACKAHGLPVSGTNEQKARRLLAAGIDTA